MELCNTVTYIDISKNFDIDAQWFLENLTCFEDVWYCCRLAGIDEERLNISVEEATIGHLCYLSLPPFFLKSMPTNYP